MGIGQSTYNRKENGESDFSLTELIKLGDVLEVSVSKFINLDLARIINNIQTSGNNGFVEHYNNNSNGEGYKAALTALRSDGHKLRKGHVPTGADDAICYQRRNHLITY
jgi:transcriptional regulator with XRE-family HTH domain